MCFVSKRIKQLALTNSPQEFMSQFRQLDYSLKYFSFSGLEDKVIATLKEQKELQKAMIFQHSKRYNRIIRKMKKE